MTTTRVNSENAIGLRTDLLYDYDDLRARGITWSRQWIHRLIDKGDFPAPVRIGSGRGKLWWRRADVDQFIEEANAEIEWRA